MKSTARARFVMNMVAPTVAISILVLAVGGGGAWYVQRLQRRSSEMVALNVSSVRAAEELEIALREVRTELNNFLITDDPRHLSDASRLIGAANNWLQRAEALATTDFEQNCMTRLRASYDQFVQELEHLTKAPGSADSRTRLHELLGTVFADQILPTARQYLDFNEETIARTSQSNQNLSRWMVAALLLLGVTGSAAGLVAGYGIARGVHQSILQLSVPVRDAAGKLNKVIGPLTVSTGSTFEDLEQELCKMADNIGMVVEQLQQSQQAVLRTEQLAAVGRLAAGVAHELRNPLTSIKVLIQSKASRSDSVTLTHRDVAVLEEEVERIEGAIQSFLDFARPPQLEKRHCILQQILYHSLDLVAGRAESQDVLIQKQLPVQPVPAEVDPTQIRQVVMNLLINALDAMPNGGTLEVSLESVPDWNPSHPSKSRSCNWAIITVADTGHGLPPQLGERIFEPFVSTKETGLGLGLSISKRIVETHGGELIGTNRETGGVVFTVSLPHAGRVVSHTPV